MPRLDVTVVSVILLAFPALAPAAELIWRAPGMIEQLDFRHGPGGPGMEPRPPFRFIDEDHSGNSAKVNVEDAAGSVWSVKFGHEAKGEVFATRLVSALGYFAEPSYFVPAGAIAGANRLNRAAKYIDASGAFTSARFELRTGDWKYLADASWRWDENPFVGTHELQGLKILLMLVSNWDNKDQRDVNRGANTGAFETAAGRWYAVTDWGASLGGWGGVAGRDKWDCEEFKEQTHEFVRGFKDGYVQFGFKGQRSEIGRDIKISDVQWLMRHLGRVRDEQIHAGLLASGANPHEVACFTESLRSRIAALRKVAESPAADRTANTNR